MADEGAADDRAGVVGSSVGARARGDSRLAQTCETLAGLAPETGWRTLAGPTGEANLYAALPREAVLCLAGAGSEGDADRLTQLAAVLAVGSREPNRFYPGMGTLFLRMMGEAFVAAMRRFSAA